MGWMAGSACGWVKAADDDGSGGVVVVLGNGDDDGADGINCRNAKLLVRRFSEVRLSLARLGYPTAVLLPNSASRSLGRHVGTLQWK